MQDIEDIYVPTPSKTNSLSSSSSPTLTSPPFLSQVKRVHLELTTKCNAACPQCGRNVHGGKVNPNLTMREMSLRDVKRVLPPDFLFGVERVNLCGNFGDPMMCSEILDIVTYLQTTNLPNKNKFRKIKLHTNGGARLKKTWARLGSLLTRERRGSCIFALDGLENTLHLYRQKVKFSIVIKNAKTFISNGGSAVWKFIVFRHNQDQIETAREMSIKLQFERFEIVKTKRFLNKREGKQKSGTPVRDEKTDKIIRYLQPPTDERYVNKGVVSETKRVIEKFGSMENYYDSAKICCKALKGKEIYISAEGFVFPCCWLGHQHGGMMPDRDRQFLKLLKNGLEEIDAKRKPISEILSSEIYTTSLPNSWSLPSVRKGKIKTCSRICGSELHTFEFEKRAGFYTKSNMSVCSYSQNYYYYYPMAIAMSILALLLYNSYNARHVTSDI